jgi:hypothetical protein
MLPNRNPGGTAAGTSKGKPYEARASPRAQTDGHDAKGPLGRCRLTVDHRIRSFLLRCGGE